MTPDEQNKAIASILGWKPVGYENFKGFEWQATPSYCGDLNCAYEMEKSLYIGGSPHGDMSPPYEGVLLHVLANDSLKSGVFTELHEVWLWHATAAQRAEAFLKLHGKWT